MKGLLRSVFAAFGTSGRKEKPGSGTVGPEGIKMLVDGIHGPQFILRKLKGFGCEIAVFLVNQGLFKPDQLFDLAFGLGKIREIPVKFRGIVIQVT